MLHDLAKGHTTEAVVDGDTMTGGSHARAIRSHARVCVSFQIRPAALRHRSFHTKFRIYHTYMVLSTLLP